MLCWPPGVSLENPTALETLTSSSTEFMPLNRLTGYSLLKQVQVGWMFKHTLTERPRMFSMLSLTGFMSLMTTDLMVTGC